MILKDHHKGKLEFAKPSTKPKPEKPDELVKAVEALTAVAGVMLEQMRKPQAAVQPNLTVTPNVEVKIDRPKKWKVQVHRNGKGDVETMDVEAVG